MANETGGTRWPRQRVVFWVLVAATAFFFVLGRIDRSDTDHSDVASDPPETTIAPLDSSVLATMKDNVAAVLDIATSEMRIEIDRSGDVVVRVPIYPKKSNAGLARVTCEAAADALREGGEPRSLTLAGIDGYNLAYWRGGPLCDLGNGVK